MLLLLVAASKRKGLWVSGSIALGYRSVNKKPQVIPEEADPRPHDYGLVIANLTPSQDIMGMSGVQSIAKSP